MQDSLSFVPRTTPGIVGAGKTFLRASSRKPCTHMNTNMNEPSSTPEIEAGTSPPQRGSPPRNLNLMLWRSTSTSTWSGRYSRGSRACHVYGPWCYAISLSMKNETDSPSWRVNTHRVSSPTLGRYPIQYIKLRHTSKRSLHDTTIGRQSWETTLY